MDSLARGTPAGVGLRSALGIAAAICAAAVLFIVIWGGLEFSIGGVRIRLTHPDRAAVLGVIFWSAYVWRRRGMGVLAQVQAANGWLERRDSQVPWVLALAAGLVLVRIQIMQHWTFQTDAYDLALYDTAIRNTLQGKFLFADPLGRHFFSDHFSPILLLFCPVYLLADTPLVLMVTQALAVAVGLGILYRIVRQAGLSPLVGIAVAGLFLNHRQMASAILYDFHPEVLGAVFLLGCIWHLRRNAGAAYWAFLLLALACKEDVPLYTAGLGAYAFFRGQRRTGILTGLISVVWAVVAWTLIIPLAGQTEVSPFVEARWSHLGSGYGAVALSLLRHPRYVLSLLLSPGVRDLLRGFGWLPLLGPEALVIALPGVVLNASSSLGAQAGLHLYYAAPILPFAAWAMVIGISRLKALADRVVLCSDRRAWVGAAGTSLLVLAAAATCGAHLPFDSFTPHARECHRIMGRLPPGTTVSAQSGFVPHLTRTHRPYLFPEEPNRRIHYSDCAYILVDRLGNPWPLDADALNATIDRLLAQPERYPLVAEGKGVLLFRNAARVPEP